MDKLEVTVIPVDDEPYSKVISVPSSMMSKYYNNNFKSFKSIQLPILTNLF